MRNSRTARGSPRGPKLPRGPYLRLPHEAESTDTVDYGNLMIAVIGYSVGEKSDNVDVTERYTCIVLMRLGCWDQFRATLALWRRSWGIGRACDGDLCSCYQADVWRLMIGKRQRVGSLRLSLDHATKGQADSEADSHKVHAQEASRGRRRL